MTYHYWFHLGESQAVRQLLGHRNLPQFVGDINQASYVPEQRARVNVAPVSRRGLARA